MNRVLDYYLLIALACFLCLAIGRALLLRRRGVRVAGANFQQSWWERLEDLIGVSLPLIR